MTVVLVVVVAPPPPTSGDHGSNDHPTTTATAVVHPYNDDNDDDKERRKVPDSPTPVAVAASSSWLHRRGPDHSGSAAVAVERWVEGPPQSDDEGCRRRGWWYNYSYYRVILQASVLQMRDVLVPQPWELRNWGGGSAAATTTTHSEDSSSSRRSHYLAWNGEVYQVLSEVHDDDDRRYQSDDVDSCAIADTPLVAKMIQSAMNDGHDETVHILHTTAQRLANQVFARLTNAEFAFAIVTDRCVYYGRDSFGRRSLLVTTTHPDACDASAHPTTPTTTTTTTTWQLASVADPLGDHDAAAAAAAAATIPSWQEVAPGRVHGYEWATGQMVQVPWDHPSFATPVTVPTLACHGGDNDDRMVAASRQLQGLLHAAVRRRCGPGTGTAVLFSGGLDSVVLAALALQCVTTLTLLTVSFVDGEADDNDHHHHRISSSSRSSRDTNHPPPAADTVAAYQSYQELQALYPQAQIHFVHRRVDWQEIAAAEPRIRALMYPKTTVMDLNIATALWFAASAADAHHGTTTDPSAPSAATIVRDAPPPPPRVLLSGLGADELLGGYGRHRQAWERGGSGTLRAELDLDLGRLWDRNLGRDDRVLADTSKEVRLPYLDSTVVQFVKAQPLDCLVNYALPPGYGDKMILRLVAQRLGLNTAASAVKRAIQFGSRIAHVSDKRRFGSRRKATGAAESAT